MMHIEQVIELFCGGPGSGRRPGEDIANKFGFTFHRATPFRNEQNSSQYKNSNGHRLQVNRSYNSEGTDNITWGHGVGQSQYSDKGYDTLKEHLQKFYGK